MYEKLPIRSDIKRELKKQPIRPAILDPLMQSFQEWDEKKQFDEPCHSHVIKILILNG